MSMNWIDKLMHYCHLCYIIVVDLWIIIDLFSECISIMMHCDKHIFFYFPNIKEVFVTMSFVLFKMH